MFSWLCLYCFQYTCIDNIDNKGWTFHYSIRTEMTSLARMAVNGDVASLGQCQNIIYCDAWIRSGWKLERENTR